jgi:hypothetical protein
VKENVEVPWLASKSTPEATLTATPAIRDGNVAADSSVEAIKATAASPNSPSSHTATSIPALTTAALPQATGSAAVDSSESPASSGLAAITESPEPSESAQIESDSSAANLPRLLRWRHFAVALKETTPSSSEALGSLADLRKWNDEFGEGQRDKKHKTVWGKGKFGFIPKPVDTEADGRVVDPRPEGKKGFSDDA